MNSITVRRRFVEKDTQNSETLHEFTRVSKASWSAARSCNHWYGFVAETVWRVCFLSVFIYGIA